MEKDIRFTGYTAVPSDYECSDGELTQAYNLINEDGAYKSLLAPKTLLQLGENKKVIYLHRTAFFSNYIIRDTKTSEIYALSENKKLFEEAELLGTFPSLSHVNSIGNTLLLFCEEYILYFLWKKG